MGCRCSKALDAYEDGGMALTTKTFALGDPKSILNTSCQEETYNLPRRILQEYDILKRISEGETSRIFLVRRKRNASHDRLEGSVSSTEQCDVEEMGTTMCRRFVLQQIDLTSMPESKRRAMTKEIQLIQDTNHPNILRIRDLSDDGNSLSLVTELCTGGDLKHYCPVSPDAAKTVIRQLLSAVAYMHAEGLYGHDLTTENIMYTDERQETIQITYAGLAGQAVESTVANVTLLNSKADDDVVKVAWIAHELLTGILPMHERGCSEKILSQTELSFITDCLQRNGRCTVKMAMEHPWMTGKLLVKPPSSPSYVQMPTTPATLPMTPSSVMSMESVEASLQTETSVVQDETMHILEDDEETRHTVESKTQRSLDDFLGSTPDEFQDLREAFDDLKSANTEVTAKELKDILRQRKQYTEQEVDTWFQGDKFEDSRKLKFTELLTAVIQSRRRLERARVAEAFQRIDKDRQGFVTVGNLRAILGTKNSEHIEQVIKEADGSRNGRIRYAAFQEVLNRWNEREENGSVFE